MPTNLRSFGPADSWTDLKDITASHPLWNLPLQDTLVFYDSDLVAIGKMPNDDSYYLRIEVDFDRGDGEMGFPREMHGIVHYLAFPSLEAIQRTLHEDEIPTLSSYRTATSIVREVTRWTLVDIGQPTNCRLEVSDVNLAEIAEDELPYSFLKPGTQMEFRAEGGHDDLTAACDPFYVWPLPEKEVLVFMDCPRAWIGETTQLGKQIVHLYTQVEDNIGSELGYRLTFADEATLRSTLYHGYVPTVESFRKATKIVRERLICDNGDPAKWTLRVETFPFSEIPQDELPNPKLRPSPSVLVLTADQDEDEDEEEEKDEALND